ncbi:MAG: PHP domain-containing protein, partial [Clostridium sp.]
MSYFSIHNHTEYSSIRLLDSINKVKDLIDRAIELGLSGVCITDHEVLSSHVEAIRYYSSLPKDVRDNFTLGLGDEIYLIDELGNKPPLGYSHFILVAKDQIGHRALREISSTAWSNSYTDRGMLRVPITKSQLSEIVKK